LAKPRQETLIEINPERRQMFALPILIIAAMLVGALSVFVRRADVHRLDQTASNAEHSTRMYDRDFRWGFFNIPIKSVVRDGTSFRIRSLSMD
jgi:hypothetical protein